jgi:hypothetical protein
LGSRVMHYCISQMVVKHFDLDRNSFILGNLAPDAHDGTITGKISSHFQIPEDSQDPNFFDVDVFIEKYIGNSDVPDDFLVGYGCHLLSDNEWFKIIWTKYLRCDFRFIYSHYVQCNDEEAERRLALCYEDYFKLNSLLIEHFRLVPEPITIPKIMPVEEIHDERLQKLIDDLYNDDFHAAGGILSLFDNDEVIDYINETSRKCVGLVGRIRKYK